MRVRRRDVKDLRDIEHSLTENLGHVEPGLEIIDSCTFLGHARVDLVGLDAHGSLILVALGMTATDEMLLRMLDAYAWYLDYPDTMRRLYPRARIQPGRVPRVMFVAESVPEAFLRKVRHFPFPEVDCLKFLNLDIDGTSAVYFDLTERLRRTSVAASPADAGVRRVDSQPVRENAEDGRPRRHELRVADNATRPSREAAELAEGGSAGETGTGRPGSSSPAPPARSEPTRPPEDWQDFLRQLAADPGSSSREDERPEPDSGAARVAGTMSTDTAAGEPEPGDAPGNEPGGSDASALPDPVDAGGLSREWRDFLDQLRTGR